MTKRKTKAQREAEQLEALTLRITDIYSGAQGSAWGDEDFANAEVISNVIPTLISVFGCPEGNGCLFRGYSLRYFDNPASASEHLFKYGYRADLYLVDEPEAEA